MGFSHGEVSVRTRHWQRGMWSGLELQNKRACLLGTMAPCKRSMQEMNPSCNVHEPLGAVLWTVWKTVVSVNTRTHQCNLQEHCKGSTNEVPD